MGIVSHQESSSIQRRTESHAVCVACQSRNRKLSAQYVLSAIPLHEPLHVDSSPTSVAVADGAVRSRNSTALITVVTNHKIIDQIPALVVERASEGLPVPHPHTAAQRLPQHLTVDPTSNHHFTIVVVLQKVLGAIVHRVLIALKVAPHHSLEALDRLVSRVLRKWVRTCRDQLTGYKGNTAIHSFAPRPKQILLQHSGAK
ncbi:hypothetical protein DQ04_12361000 [Trypanosoma grayi]|uniref:hypothetical protein n=1 Tax=Trypanosoma grayi TaxID=71804 RepID=UPI0004F405F1|nr:hypothetical protein DQ04_12361000 [Trypanosoma grayi]KEG06762.1 hypothetical protein DQ04_12361000 [Trypanosoma grayi]